MADEKLNTGQEENPQPSLFDNGPEGAPAQDAPTPEPPTPENVPEQAAGDAPAQDAPAGAPGEVNVSADQIEKLMAERRAAERAEVEKNEPPEPEQPPTPAPEEKAAEKKGPAKEGKTTGEKAPEPEKPKGRRGRKPKEEKAGPGEPGGTGARRGRPAKADKAATDKPPSPPRDKMSQGKGGKAATVKGKEEAPAAPQPAPEVPPQPRDATRAEKEEIVYLNLSELFPFKDHPFGVRDVTLWDYGGTAVDFSMGSSGIGSSTTYWGIQYVPSGERLGFQGSRLEGWISDRDGWRWEESGGDNRCYIQELDERWYYYEMSF